MGVFLMQRIQVAFVMVVVCGLSACAGQSEVAELEKKVAAVEAQIETLRTSLESIESARSFEELIRDMDAVAFLTPGAEGYSTITTDLGRMTVMLANVQPYANGTRVTLRIGNLTSATVNGAKAKVEWGSVDEKGSPKNESAKSRQVSFSQALRSGAWTNVQVVLEAVPPADLGFVRIREFSHSGISLLR